MWQNAHDTYLESRVLSADPIELVRMLYQAAIKAVGDARRHLAAGDIAARARSISQASAVLMELASSLDHERGGSVSANLAQLYDYLLRRLIEANLQQSDAPLAEALGLLGTLSEGWDGVKAQTAEAPPAEPEKRRQASVSEFAARAENPWAPPVDPEAAPTYGSFRQPVSEAESISTFGSPWAEPSTVQPAAAYSSPWERPVSDEPASAYGSAWAQVEQNEPAAAYASHDWSL